MNYNMYYNEELIVEKLKCVNKKLIKFFLFSVKIDYG